MHQLHIVTVGISLLTNFEKAANLPREKILRQHAQIKEFLKTDPLRACSEINSLHARTGLLDGRPKELAVTLVVSATAGREGQLAARLIGAFLKGRGIRVTELRLRDIGVPAQAQANPAEAARLAQEGLEQLWEKLERHIRRAKERNGELEIALNATGGYKAEAAILYGVGCKLGLPVYYLHETYRAPITLPLCAADT